MNADINRLFPEGLKHAKEEQGKPRHDTLLRFVPPRVSEKEDNKDTNLKVITIVLDQDTTQKVAPYEFTVIESFLKMQINFDYLLSQ